MLFVVRKQRAEVIGDEMVQDRLGRNVKQQAKQPQIGKNGLLESRWKVSACSASARCRPASDKRLPTRPIPQRIWVSAPSICKAIRFKSVHAFSNARRESARGFGSISKNKSGGPYSG